MNYSLHDFIGNVGLFLLLGTYLLLQMERVSSSSLGYSVSNAVASLLIGISLLYQFNLSAFMVEAFWFVISIYGIYKFMRSRSKRAITP